MSLESEIANLNRAALAAHQEWGIDHPMTVSIRGQLADLKRRREAESQTRTGGFFARRVSPSLLLQRAADEAALGSRGGLNW